MTPSGIDAYYTPPWLAADIASQLFVDDDVPVGLRVVDVAAGDGVLLRAVRELAPTASLTAFDVDIKTVRRLRRRHPDWAVGRVDVYSERSRRSCATWRAQGFDAMVLNPPFSYRGGATRPAGLGVSASPAMTFLFRGLELLRPGGIAVALLPANCLNSEKDALARDRLASRALIECVETYGRTTFAGAHARMVLVCVRLHPLLPVADVEEVRPKAMSSGGTRGGHTTRAVGCKCLLLRRGRIPMHELTRFGHGPLVPLVHSTQLQHGRVLRGEHQASRKYAIASPAVLLPRVGRPESHKVVAYRGRAIALSDCVFGVECASRDDAELLRDELLQSFDLLSASYGGSCAPYLTIQRLSALIQSLGWAMHPYGQASCPGVQSSGATR